MYKERANFCPPNKDSQIIWRYIDFTKLIALLETQSLFFCRLDLLEDEYEGVSPANELDYLARHQQGKENYEYEKHLSIVRESELWQRRCIGINCWHMNDYESLAMWKIYLKNSEGVAIKSTYKSLRDSFHLHQEDEVAIGVVNYVDYDKHKWENKLWYNVTHKRIFFDFERELRAMILRYPKNMASLSNTSELFKSHGFEGGVNVKVDLYTLINEIVVSPFAPSWFNSLVESVLKKYGGVFKVSKSKLTK